MGFLDHTTNNIIVDAVLTDAGRAKLASAKGLRIIQYAFADTEVDYTLLKKYGEIVGKEKIEKNTPIYEANTADTDQNRHSLLQDAVGGNVETIAVTSVGPGTPVNGQLTYNVTGAGFDANMTGLTLEVIYTHTYWSVSASSGIGNVGTPYPVNDPANLLHKVLITGLSVDSNGNFGPSTLIFDIDASQTGTRTAAFTVSTPAGISAETVTAVLS